MGGGRVGPRPGGPGARAGPVPGGCLGADATSLGHAAEGVGARESRARWACEGFGSLEEGPAAAVAKGLQRGWRWRAGRSGLRTTGVALWALVTRWPEMPRGRPRRSGLSLSHVAARLAARLHHGAGQVQLKRKPEAIGVAPFAPCFRTMVTFIQAPLVAPAPVSTVPSA